MREKIKSLLKNVLLDREEISLPLKFIARVRDTFKAFITRCYTISPLQFIAIYTTTIIKRLVNMRLRIRPGDGNRLA